MIISVCNQKEGTGALSDQLTFQPHNPNLQNLCFIRLIDRLTSNVDLCVDFVANKVSTRVTNTVDQSVSPPWVPSVILTTLEFEVIYL